MSLMPATCHRIDEIVRLRQSGGRAPVVIAGVVRSGELVYVTSAGDTTSLAETPAGVQSRVGSISKTFTAALVLGLRDEGRLDIDEPIAAHLAGLPIGRVTPRHLLAHVGGLRREPDGPFWERNPGVDIQALLAGIGKGTVIAPPMRGHHYSNLGYALLGAVIADLTGGSWADAVASRICKPLGLNRTTYAPEDPYLRGYVAHPYADVLREEPREDAGAMAPAGQIWSTVGDLGRWAAFLADPASAGLNAPLATGTVDEMCLPVATTDPDSWSSGHSLGLQMWRSGDRVYVGHSGSMPGYLAIVMTHRKSRTAVVGFANAYALGPGSIDGLGLELLTAVLDAEPDLPRPWTEAEPPADVRDLLGVWWWMGFPVDVVWDGGLAMRNTGQTDESTRYDRAAADEWRCAGGWNAGETMYVRRDGAGTPIELDIATCIFTRDPWPDVVL